MKVKPNEKGYVPNHIVLYYIVCQDKTLAIVQTIYESCTIWDIVSSWQVLSRSD